VTDKIDLEAENREMERVVAEMRALDRKPYLDQDIVEIAFNRPTWWWSLRKLILWLAGQGCGDNPCGCVLRFSNCAERFAVYTRKQSRSNAVTDPAVAQKIVDALDAEPAPGEATPRRMRAGVKRRMATKSCSSPAFVDRFANRLVELPAGDDLEPDDDGLVRARREQRKMFRLSGWRQAAYWWSFSNWSLTDLYHLVIADILTVLVVRRGCRRRFVSELPAGRAEVLW
jgi:hypothetical protein